MHALVTKHEHPQQHSWSSQAKRERCPEKAPVFKECLAGSDVLHDDDDNDELGCDAEPVRTWVIGPHSECSSGGAPGPGVEQPHTCRSGAW